MFRSITSSVYKKKEPRCECLSEAKVSHSHKMWTEVSSSVPHFLQMGLLLSTIIYRCFLRVLCLVSRPITTLNSVLLKANNRALVARSGPEIVIWLNISAVEPCKIGKKKIIICRLFVLKTIRVLIHSMIFHSSVSQIFGSVGCLTSATYSFYQNRGDRFLSCLWC